MVGTKHWRSDACEPLPAQAGYFCVTRWIARTKSISLKHTIILLAALLLVPSAIQSAANRPNDAIHRLLEPTTDSESQLEKAKRLGLLEVEPVHLPPESAGDCNHYGWPIATMTGDTLIVMHRRIPGHNPKGAGKPDPSMSYGIVLRSGDGGQTWSEPYDLRDCMKPEDRLRGGIVPLSHRAKFDKANKSDQGYKVHLHAIGTARDGAVVAINNHGVFRSDDAGRTWRHFSTALREDTFPHEIVNLGPRILDHPNYGLLSFGNWFGEANSYHQLSNRLVALNSRDGGASWNVEEHDAGFPQYEPAVFLHNDRFLFVTRDQTKVRAHQQMSWSPGSKPDVLETNLEDPRLVDTVDFSLNPVTGRFEIVRSERHRMELWLWSMAPADWDTGQWRRECRLLAREGKFYSTADGFHPAGAVIDEKRRKQHIFIYSGHPNGPAGVYRITRTLNTPKLTAALAPAKTRVQISPPPFDPNKGGVALTFDDRNFQDWIDAIPLFDKYGVKATFFISGEINQPALDAARRLQRRGHAIGFHGVHHLKAVDYSKRRSAEDYVSAEIEPQLAAFKAAGIAPTSFAYPSSQNNAVTDSAILKTTRHIRTGAGLAPGAQIAGTDRFFTPANQIGRRGCLDGKGIDYAPAMEDRTFEQLDAALERAAKDKEILTLYAHGIAVSKRGHHITPAALERIFQKARELNLPFYTFDQLP